MRTSPLTVLTIEGTRGQRLRQQIAVDGRDRQLQIGARIGQRDVARDALDHARGAACLRARGCRSHPAPRTSPLTLVTRMSPETVRRSTDASAGTFTSNSTSTPRPSRPPAYSTRSSDAVAARVGLDRGVAEPLLGLFGIGSPGVFQRLRPRSGRSPPGDT